MKIVFDRPTIYMSHPIRGSNDDLEGNTRRAVKASERLKGLFPEVNLYCPGEHDLSLQVLWNNGTLTVEQIMEADLEILSACHGWLFYYFDESSGSMIEAKRAYELDLPRTVIVSDIAKLSTPRLRLMLTPFVIETIERFRSNKNEQQI